MQKVKTGGATKDGKDGLSMDPSLLSDLEEELRKLRAELEAFKAETAKQLRQIEMTLAENNASKTDVELAEERLNQRIDELANRDHDTGNFAEKEPVKKKFQSIEKNVSFIPKRLIFIHSCKTYTTWSWRAERLARKKMPCSRRDIWVLSTALRARRTSPISKACQRTTMYGNGFLSARQPNALPE